MQRIAVALCPIILFLTTSCGPLRTSSYKSGGGYQAQGDQRSQEEMATPSEIYNSREVIKSPSHSGQKGPFKLQWPVRKLKVNRGFSSENPRHLGLDIDGNLGDPILAAHHGLVIYAGSGFRGYGRMVIIEFDSQWATLYAHLNSLKVTTGQEIQIGTVIGTMGRSGRATGVHLHFELMREKQPIDPLPLLQSQRSIASR